MEVDDLEKRLRDIAKAGEQIGYGKAGQDVAVEAREMLERLKESGLGEIPYARGIEYAVMRLALMLQRNYERGYK